MIKLQSPLSLQFRSDWIFRNYELEKTTLKSNSFSKCTSILRAKSVICDIKQQFSFEEIFQIPHLPQLGGSFTPRKYDEPVSVQQPSSLQNLSYRRVTNTFNSAVLTNAHQSHAELEYMISSDKPSIQQDSKLDSCASSLGDNVLSSVNLTTESILSDQDIFDYEGPTDWDSDSTTISLPSSETFSVSSAEIDTDDNASDLNTFSSATKYRTHSTGKKYRCSSILRSKSRLPLSEESDIEEYSTLQKNETSRSYGRKYKTISRFKVNTALEDSDTEEYEISDDDCELQSQFREYEDASFTHRFCTEQSPSYGIMTKSCVIQPDISSVHSLLSPPSRISGKLEQLVAKVERCTKNNHHCQVVQKRKKTPDDHFIQKKSQRLRSSANSVFSKRGAKTSASIKG